MSIHPSLRKGRRKFRSVLKRFERLKKAMIEEKWKEGDSIYNLPKFNPPRIKKNKSDETKTVTDKVDILEEHKLAKEKAGKDKKTKKNKKETVGRK